MKAEYQKDIYTITVDELRKKLKRIKGDAKVYIVLDKGDDNWDCENGCWKIVHPVENAEREFLYQEDGDECNCILYLQDAFYEDHKVVTNTRLE